MMKDLFALAGVCFFAAQIALAGPGSASKPLSAQDQEALQKTQELLKNKAERERAAQKTEQGRNADRAVKNLAPEAGDQQAIYELAADVFPQLVQEAEGDPTKMTEILTQYLQNPEKFASKWTPEQKARLKALGAKLDKQGAPAAKP